MIYLMKFTKAIITGFSTGLAISIPLGPAAIKSVDQTISKGFKKGFVISLGAITADMAYLILINCGLSKLLKTNKITEALFWIISGTVLTFMEYNSIKKLKNQNKNKYDETDSLSFWSGFIITFSNPMTPALWLGLSSTALKLWHHAGNMYYYVFLISLLAGMITWFGVLNFLALKGLKIFKNNSSKKISSFTKWIILILGIFFILFGIVKLILAL
ncbi:LysE family transporter [Clostridium aestuarii]|uniref:LysE family transporter n=1 Tax=Clostridium aestuarii TaxID=338193 RepID=A0ABT4D281_9CLOT|nr:LysE family transporter [Clostridium aestuarii]MCY6485357.1 LysE family transporter [Clostridium aestuarii]